MLAAAALAAYSPATHAATFFDDFNRPDAPNLGANWTTQNGSIGISGNRAASSDPATSFVTVNGFSGSYLTTKLVVDALSTSTDLNYVALMLGFADAGHNIFAKVQDQGGNGNYNYAAFYYGNNVLGVNFFAITPFRNGRLSLFATGATTFELDIDSDFDGVADQILNRTYDAAQIAGLGTGIGLGMYGPALADNFGANVPVPEPGTMALVGLGLAGFASLKRKST